MFRRLADGVPLSRASNRPISEQTAASAPLGKISQPRHRPPSPGDLVLRHSPANQTARQPKRSVGDWWPLAIGIPSSTICARKRDLQKPLRHQPNSTLHRNRTPPPIHSSSIPPPPRRWSSPLGPSAPPRTQKKCNSRPLPTFPPVLVQRTPLRTIVRVLQHEVRLL